MSAWLNHVAIAAPRNGTTTHTVTPSSGTAVAGALFTPTAGRFLVCTVEGAVTSTTPSGWTLAASAVNNTGLYVWYRASAAGSDSITTTHNGSNYPLVFDFYEFPSASTWVNAVSATAVSSGAAGPSLTGLTGTNQVYATAGQDANATRPGPFSASWAAGATLVNTSVAYSSTDGYTYGAAEFVNDTASSQSDAWTSTNTGDTVERLMWAVSVPAGGGTTYPVTGTTSGSSTTSGAVTAVMALTGTDAAASATTGAPVALLQVTAATAGLSAASGAVTGVMALSGTTTGTSTTAGNLAALMPLSGTAIATSAMTGSIDVAGGPVAFTGTTAATSGASGAVTLLAALSGTDGAASATSGAPMLVASLSGVATAAATSSGVLAALLILSGAASALSATTGAMTLFVLHPPTPRPGLTLDPHTASLTLTAHAPGLTIAPHTTGLEITP